MTRIMPLALCALGAYADLARAYTSLEPDAMRLQIRESYKDIDYPILQARTKRPLEGTGSNKQSAARQRVHGPTGDRGGRPDDPYIPNATTQRMADHLGDPRPEARARGGPQQGRPLPHPHLHDYFRHPGLESPKSSLRSISSTDTSDSDTIGQKNTITAKVQGQGKIATTPRMDSPMHIDDRGKMKIKVQGLKVKGRVSSIGDEYYSDQAPNSGLIAKGRSVRGTIRPLTDSSIEAWGREGHQRLHVKAGESGTLRAKAALTDPGDVASRARVKAYIHAAEGGEISASASDWSSSSSPARDPPASPPGSPLASPPRSPPRSPPADAAASPPPSPPRSPPRPPLAAPEPPEHL